jgi:hypothetical protein
MYIVAIAWLYVTVLMAATEHSFLAGVSTLFFYGLMPCSIVMYLLGAPGRRRAIKAREQAELAQQAEQAQQTTEHPADPETSGSTTETVQSDGAQAPLAPLEPNQTGLPSRDRIAPE